ncbi:uncharacterized protein ARMOST_21811 [Armillaria ostoyae]|uniref:Uncharacterized protein n=1 Tax=Armillaria ostoyae TaxID=47428 RepID=A0A284SB46_ARMOS|nr:uncharacterized protein ARMOST_21811 [Armillaria ostoyae]
MVALSFLRPPSSSEAKSPAIPPPSTPTMAFSWRPSAMPIVSSTSQYSKTNDSRGTTPLSNPWRLFPSSPSATAVVSTAAGALGDTARTSSVVFTLVVYSPPATISSFSPFSPQTIAASFLSALSTPATMSTPLWEASAAVYTVAIAAVVVGLPLSPPITILLASYQDGDCSQASNTPGITSTPQLPTTAMNYVIGLDVVDILLMPPTISPDFALILAFDGDYGSFAASSAAPTSGTAE